MARKRKLTRRRDDDDPVRVYDDGRIAYWTGGSPGAGTRKLERCGTREAAGLRATQVRKQLLAHQPAPKGNVTLDELMRAAVKHWMKVGRPTGTIQQYRSDWNTHVPPEIGAVRCRDVDISHYTAIFDELNEEQASVQVIDAVARTLGAVAIEFGVLDGYFPDGQPFGGPDLRRATAAEARATAPGRTAPVRSRYTSTSAPRPPTWTSTRPPCAAHTVAGSPRQKRNARPQAAPSTCGHRHPCADARQASTRRGSRRMSQVRGPSSGRSTMPVTVKPRRR